MIRPDFERCTELATELLYKQHNKNRILDIRKMKYDKTIIFESIQNYCALTRHPLSDFLSEDKQILKDGCTLIDRQNNIYIVLYNAEITYFEHLNWTLAHEVGHIYLGHITDGKREEIEAHFFAAQLFMPEYSIMMISREHGTVTVNDLVEIFGVSPEAADRRIQTMNRKYSVRASLMDKAIWTIQKERVDMYYECEKISYNYRSLLSYMLEREEEFIRMAERDFEEYMALAQ